MQELVEPRLAGRIAFTYPDFSIYQVARFFIVAALEMQSVAVGWQVYEITKRPLDLGLIGLAQFLPGVCREFWPALDHRLAAKSFGPPDLRSGCDGRHCARI